MIGTRSFSSDPALVSSMVAAQVKGYQKDGGVIASPKHFPGHGDTATDSHTGIPVITHTRAQWEQTDAPPFRAAIKAGTLFGVVDQGWCSMGTQAAVAMKDLSSGKSVPAFIPSQLSFYDQSNLPAG